MLALRAETQTIPILFVNSKLVISVILILILVICGAVKSRSKNLLASAAAAAQPKLPDRATKVKGADEANRRLMALSEEDRRSVFLRILALANLRRDHAHLLSSASEAMERTVSWRPLIRHKSGGIQRAFECKCDCAPRHRGTPSARRCLPSGLPL